ncbi:signal peptidase I [Lysinibacillus odysseyi]|uniref:Signal peptidase I n=1 Tax=Lysinibacillus odysseyi 34hs-1 = NBRC 100172 TaxID=1220589 RepID=A0A0A3IDS2_9BACI|nr:signal peptidase I [Lysinibacillus odysseyi]KGR82911.1 hypothetical protein CD32_18950 [Lysinibacillus odysseyi 34hs-1 = NBRC 100172]
MDEKLKALKEEQSQQTLSHITFTQKDKQAVLERVKRKKIRFRFMPQAAFILFTLITVSSLYLFISDSSLEEETIETISDVNTPESPQILAVSGEMFTIDWLSDAMDRGNHDYVTSYHSPLVVDSEIAAFKRGEVIYYQMPSSVNEAVPNTTVQNIGRIVGLPGETVEIIDGHVWIDDKKLLAFYAEATMHGLNETVYFEKINPGNIADEEAARAYFSTEMPPVTVGENEVFVLVDQWWRGADSKDYGPLRTDQIIGIVKGYAQ